MNNSPARMRGPRAGATLVEVVVAMLLVTLMTSGIFVGVVQGTRMNYAAAQHIVAFGLCKERLEQMRGVAFTSVTEGNFPAEDMTLTHLGGSDRATLACKRASTITELTDPVRKAVSVTVQWSFNNWDFLQSADGAIFYKDGSVEALSTDHNVGGQININPNNRPDYEFILAVAGGTVITRDDLTDGFGGYAGAAQLVHVRPKGNGNQNALVVDAELFPVENGSSLDISSTDMTVNLYNDTINPQGKAVGKWWISISANDATVTVY